MIAERAHLMLDADAGAAALYQEMEGNGRRFPAAIG